MTDQCSNCRFWTHSAYLGTGNYDDRNGFLPDGGSIQIGCCKPIRIRTTEGYMGALNVINEELPSAGLTLAEFCCGMFEKKDRMSWGPLEERQEKSSITPA